MATKFTAALFLALVSTAAAVPSIPALTRQVVPRKLPPPNPFCPWDTLKMAACASALGDLSGLLVGQPLGNKCCPLLEGLATGEAAACLCTVVKESALGLTTLWTVKTGLLVSQCKKKVPDRFKCV